MEAGQIEREREVSIMLDVKFHPISGSEFSAVQFSILFGMDGEILHMVWS